MDLRDLQIIPFCFYYHFPQRPSFLGFGLIYQISNVFLVRTFHNYFFSSVLDVRKENVRQGFSWIFTEFPSFHV